MVDPKGLSTESAVNGNTVVAGISSIVRESVMST
jgi:hypothetical protein